MAATIKESVYSPVYTSIKNESNGLWVPESITASYIIYDTESYTEASTALQTQAPETIDGLIKKSVKVDPKAVYPAGEGKGYYYGEVQYSSQTINSEYDTVFEFDTGGGSRHITQSLLTVNRYAPSGKTARDFKGAIGVTSDSVQGVDIVISQYTWSETIWMAGVDSYYRGILSDLTGTVNETSFRDFPAGEVLFMGCSGRRKGNGYWEMNYKFQQSKNQTNLAVGDITVAVKNGWDYLWVGYSDEADLTAKRIVKRPSDAFVERVYERRNFASLSIGI